MGVLKGPHWKAARHWLLFCGIYTDVNSQKENPGFNFWSKLSQFSYALSGINNRRLKQDLKWFNPIPLRRPLYSWAGASIHTFHPLQLHGKGLTTPTHLQAAVIESPLCAAWGGPRDKDIKKTLSVPCRRYALVEATRQKNQRNRSTHISTKMYTYTQVTVETVMSKSP